MGRFCILCNRVRPNEAFGGEGERARVCRWCRRLPRTKRIALKCEQEILASLEQTHVPDKNLARLRALKSPPDAFMLSLPILQLWCWTCLWSHRVGAAVLAFWLVNTAIFCSEWRTRD